jgi:hypothetical protein
MPKTANCLAPQTRRRNLTQKNILHGADFAVVDERKQKQHDGLRILQAWMQRVVGNYIQNFNQKKECCQHCLARAIQRAATDSPQNKLRYNGASEGKRLGAQAQCERVLARQTSQLEK